MWFGLVWFGLVWFGLVWFGLLPSGVDFDASSVDGSSSVSQEELLFIHSGAHQSSAKSEVN